MVLSINLIYKIWGKAFDVNHCFRLKIKRAHTFSHKQEFFYTYRLYSVIAKQLVNAESSIQMWRTALAQWIVNSRCIGFESFCAVRALYTKTVTIKIINRAMKVNILPAFDEYVDSFLLPIHHQRYVRTLRHNYSRADGVYKRIPNLVITVFADAPALHGVSPSVGTMLNKMLNMFSSK